jgi:addiction module HigA family antidote
MFHAAKRFRRRMEVCPGAALRIWEGSLVTGVPSHVQQIARMRMRFLNNIEEFSDLHLLQGLRPGGIDRKGRGHDLHRSFGIRLVPLVRMGARTMPEPETGVVHPMNLHLRNVHPGEVLLEEFMRPYGMSRQLLARRSGIPLDRLTAVLRGSAAIDADIAIKLNKVLGMHERFWLGLQNDYDIEEVYRSRREAKARGAG